MVSRREAERRRLAAAAKRRSVLTERDEAKLEAERPPDHYFETLNIDPHAPLRDVALTAYTSHLQKRMDGEAHVERLKIEQAYRVVYGWHEERRRLERDARRRRKVGKYLPAAMVVLFFSSAMLAQQHQAEIKMALVSFEPGDTVLLRDHPFPSEGDVVEVVRFEHRHHFRAGNPGPAYQVRRPGAQRTTWVSEHQAVHAWVRVERHVFEDAESQALAEAREHQHEHHEHDAASTETTDGETADTDTTDTEPEGVVAQDGTDGRTPEDGEAS